MKPRLFVFLVIPIWLAGLLLAQVSTPELGVVRYGDSTVRPIYGVEANLVVGSGAIYPVPESNPSRWFKLQTRLAFRISADWSP